MARVGYSSRSRIAIEWYDDEAEAEARAKHMFETESAESIDAANLGYVQCGRDTGFDRTVNGQRQYAVVVP